MQILGLFGMFLDAVAVVVVEVEGLTEGRFLYLMNFHAMVVFLDNFQNCIII